MKICISSLTLSIGLRSGGGGNFIHLILLFCKIVCVNILKWSIKLMISIKEQKLVFQG